MDAVDQEAYSFLKQQIVQRIYWESHYLGQQPLSQAVIDAVCQHYHQGALSGITTSRLSWLDWLTASTSPDFQVSQFVRGSLFHVTPQLLDGQPTKGRVRTNSPDSQTDFD